MEGYSKVFKIKKSKNDSNKKSFCNICHKTFPYNSSLVKHIRVHTGEKPYFCFIDGCQKSFSQASNLMRHRRCHSGLKPFTCEMCLKTFNSKANLKSHTVIHYDMMNRTKLDCFIKGCSKNFLYLSTFKKHLINVHPEEFEKINEAFPQQTFKYTIKNIYSKKFEFLNEIKIETNDNSISVCKEAEEKEYSVQKNVEFSITTNIQKQPEEGRSTDICKINNKNNESINNNNYNCINNQLSYYPVNQKPEELQIILSLLNILQNTSTYAN